MLGRRAASAAGTVLILAVLSLLGSDVVAQGSRDPRSRHDRSKRAREARVNRREQPRVRTPRARRTPQKAPRQQPTRRRTPQTTPRQRPARRTPQKAPRQQPTRRRAPQSTPRQRPARRTPQKAPRQQPTRRRAPQSTPRQRPARRTPQKAPRQQPTRRRAPQSTPRQGPARRTPQKAPRQQPTRRRAPQTTPRQRPTRRSTPRTTPRLKPTRRAPTLGSPRKSSRAPGVKRYPGSSSQRRATTPRSKAPPSTTSRRRTTPRTRRPTPRRFGVPGRKTEPETTPRRGSRTYRGSFRGRNRAPVTGERRDDARITPPTVRSKLGRRGVAGIRPPRGASTPRARSSARRARRTSPGRLKPVELGYKGLGRGATDWKARRARRPGAYLKPYPEPVRRDRHDGRRDGRRSGRRGDHRRHRRSHREHSHLDFGLFFGGRGWGFGLGYTSHRYYGSSFQLGFGFGGGPWYAGSYLHTTDYGPFWDYYYYGVRTPYHLGYASPAHVQVGSPVFHLGFYRHARFHFGFDYYHPFAVHTPYPFYRACYYEPYYVKYYAAACPTYRTYYHTRYVPVYDAPVYTETCDPYVDEEVVVDVGDIGAPYDADLVLLEPEGELVDPVPPEFRAPFAPGVPDGLEFDEYLAWGEEALYGEDYLSAAEAFRRAMVLRWDDDYPKFQLALALFGAARYRLSSLAIELGLDQNPAWLHRRFNVADSFASRDAFAVKVNELERHLIQEERDFEARLVLGYVYYFSGNLFGARSVLKVLVESGAEFRHLASMAREAERRLVDERR